MKTKILLGILTGALISGCSFKPDMPTRHIEYRSGYEATNVSQMWWKSYNDTQLNALIDSALANNSDLMLALNNIERARLNLGLSKLEYLPNIGISGSAMRQNNYANMPDSNSHASYAISAPLSYEIDFWGRVRNSVGASAAQYMGTKYDYETAKNTITSAVASSYFALLSLKEQERILTKSLKSYEQTQNYRKKELEAGAINQITLSQASAAVQNAKASLIAVQNQISQVQTSLAILAGKSYDGIVNPQILTAAKLPNAPQIPSGVPSDVLLHRPDVAKALEDLRASNFLVGVAKAGYFPTISLTGAFGYASSDFDRLISSTTSSWSIGGSLVGPLLDFGRTKKRVDIANVDQNSSFIAYDKALKTALGDVKDALTTLKNAKERKKAMSDLLSSQRKIYKDATELYNAGYSSHLEFLDAQRNLLNTELAKVGADLEELEASVNAYKALGGGFSISDEELKEILGADADTAPDMSAVPIDRIFR
ncbi:MAG: TolC family protein [Campylobacter sp.]|nr:TolC family protein [Campylobacter sp.]